MNEPNAIPVKRTVFMPSARQVQWLIVVGFSIVFYALYLRYFAIENTAVGVACDAGLQTWLCKARAVAIYLFTRSVFGIAAVIIALLNLIHPSIVLMSAGLVAAGAGVVLYNTGLSGLAVALLILGLARPAPATE